MRTSLSLSILEFEKAISSLEESLGLYSTAPVNSASRKAFRDACIQRFEYSIEIAWKLSMKVLGSQTAAAKPAVREMARNNLISDAAAWLLFIDARNNTSHSYDDDIAQKVFVQIEIFLPEAKKLSLLLQKQS
jgi:nucleotidyltransferase substrate binding protein (TIGR01987 family)